MAYRHIKILHSRGFQLLGLILISLRESPVVVKHSNIVIVEGKMLCHVQGIWISLMQPCVDFQRTIIFAPVLIQLTLDIKQGLVVGIRRESLADKPLKTGIVTAVNTEVHRR